MTVTQDAPAPLKISPALAGKARTCIRAAVMYDREGESYPAIARALGLPDADHARRAADAARAMIGQPEQDGP
jgi:hypothetical protein